jgi:hypothetical protein
MLVASGVTPQMLQSTHTSYLFSLLKITRQHNALPRPTILQHPPALSTPQYPDPTESALPDLQQVGGARRTRPATVFDPLSVQAHRPLGD